jgi:hypothetical protein
MGDFLRNVRCDSILTQCAHQLLLIVTLVGAERDPTLARDLWSYPVWMDGVGLR